MFFWDAFCCRGWTPYLPRRLLAPLLDCEGWSPCGAIMLAAA